MNKYEYLQGCVSEHRGPDEEIVQRTVLCLLSLVSVAPNDS